MTRLDQRILFLSPFQGDGSFRGKQTRFRAKLGTVQTFRRLDSRLQQSTLQNGETFVFSFRGIVYRPFVGAGPPEADKSASNPWKFSTTAAAAVVVTFLTCCMYQKVPKLPRLASVLEFPVEIRMRVPYRPSQSVFPPTLQTADKTGVIGFVVTKAPRMLRFDFCKSIP